MRDIFDRLGRGTPRVDRVAPEPSDWRLLRAPHGGRFFDAQRGDGAANPTMRAVQIGESPASISRLPNESVAAIVAPIIEQTYRCGAWGEGHTAQDRISSLGRFVDRLNVSHSAFYLIGWTGAPRWPNLELECHHSKGLTFEHGYVVDQLCRKIGRKFQVLCGTKDNQFFNQALLALSVRPLNGAGRWSEASES